MVATSNAKNASSWRTPSCSRSSSRKVSAPAQQMWMHACHACGRSPRWRPHHMHVMHAPDGSGGAYAISPQPQAQAQAQAQGFSATSGTGRECYFRRSR
jgi:hypothetical protein